MTKIQVHRFEELINQTALDKSLLIRFNRDGLWNEIPKVWTEETVLFPKCNNGIMIIAKQFNFFSWLWVLWLFMGTV